MSEHRAISTAVVGVGGYTGRELMRLLERHPVFDVVGVFGSSRTEPGTPIGALHPALRHLDDRVDPYVDAGDLPAGVQLVFLATPHEASASIAPGVLELGATVADLSAAFRLADPGAYEQYYRFVHPHPDLLARATYAMPEHRRAHARLNGAAEPPMPGGLLAIPGCYPTASILASAPLVASGLATADAVITVDATSGVSGAGKPPKAHTSFCEVSLQPYGVLGHRHEPEIIASCGTDVVFTPHLGAYDRGILATVHVPLRDGVTGGDVQRVFDRAYGGEPFVRRLPAGEYPSVGAVRGTNFVDLAWAVDERRSRAIVFAAIDNLVKGASGQAVQSANAAFGLPETLGLVAAHVGASGTGEVTRA